ncbi:hypothetical protein Micbo1qcDRAFT_195308 [Microdochium bolleyi]|uniref:DHHA2 domain-containing protein n=1 Tax=Microdochium bolleyi TaxID=196109 RepID=A0A136J5I5_9PEZI|nr:hypothetical protein Micbo1qcDRAFT_195308 [Microdochium bolleyi]
MILRPAARRTMATTLSAFLAQARAALAAPRDTTTAAGARAPRQPLTFVVGNESADLDSLCSALVLAYFKSQPALRASPEGSSPSSSSPVSQDDPRAQRGSSSTLHIPLCNIPRADLALRPELTAVLRGAALTPAEVLTLDDLPPVASSSSPPSPSALNPEDTRWLLVDHNVLTGPLARDYAAQGGAVVGCIDHHEDEGRLPGACDPKIVEKSGSCMSLVVEHCRGVWDDMSSSKDTQTQEQQQQQQEEQQRLDGQLAHLILAPILIDTNNLRDTNKTTAHDTEVVGYIERTKITSLAPSTNDNNNKNINDSNEQREEAGRHYDRDAYFSHISLLKNDISTMSLRDILRKDYKEWTETTGADSGGERSLRLGTMSVPQPMGYLLEHTCGGDQATLLRGLRQWAGEKELDVASIMTAYEDPESGGFKRDLFVWAPARQAGRGDRLAAHAVSRFVEEHGDALKLVPWRAGLLDFAADGGGEDGDGFRRCWTQGTLKNSRKQIAPMLRGAMRAVA